MLKIYIDSVFKTTDSKSNTDFKIQLKQPLEISQNMKLFITDINIPNSFYTIEETNKYLYVRIYENDRYNDYAVSLTPKNYSVIDLSTEIQTKLNAATNKTFNISFDANTGKYTFNTALTNFTYEIYSDDTLKTLKDWRGRYFNKDNPKSCNNVLRNYFSGLYSSTNPFISGFINTINYDSIYIRSNISNFSNIISPDGSLCDIVKKVNINEGFGSLITYYLQNGIDYTQIISRNNLGCLEFRITDIYNNVIDLHGSNVSFTLIFLE